MSLSRLIPTLALLGALFAPTAGAAPTTYARPADGVRAEATAFSASPHLVVSLTDPTNLTVSVDNGDTWVLTTDDPITVPLGIECTHLTAPTRVECLENVPIVAAGIEIWAGPGIDTVTGAPSLSAPMFVFPGAGSNAISTGSGDDVLDGFNNAPAAGTVNDFRGGRGGDTFIGGPGQDSVYYDEDFGVANPATRTAASPVHVTLDCIANDGNSTFDDGPNENAGCSSVGIDTVVGSLGPDTIVGDSGPNFLAGGSNSDASDNDILDGGAGNDTLHGGPGDDLITGGTGADTVVAGDGGDTLKLRDGGDELSISCGAGEDATELDAVAVDLDDKINADCEPQFRSRTAGGDGGFTVGGGSTGTGGTGGSGTPTPTAPTPSPFPTIGAIPGTLAPFFAPGTKLALTKVARMPDYVGRRATVDQVQLELGLTRDLNVQYKLKPAPLSSLPKASRASAKPYQVFATVPAKGAKLTSGFPKPAQVVELSYYDPKVPKDANCPYAGGKVKVGSGTLDMWAVIRGMGVFEGADALDDLGCNYEITGLDYTRKVEEAGIYKFSAVTVKGKKLLRVRIGVPKQPDFRATFNEPIHPGFESELGLADDGSVVAASQSHNTGVTVIERATARIVQNLPVKLLAPNGDVIAAGVTNSNGFVHLQYSFPQSAGQLRLVMELVEPRTGEVLMSAVQSLQVVSRPEGWTDMNGNVMVRDTGTKLVRYKRSGAVKGRAKSGRAARSLGATANADLYESLRQSLIEAYTFVFNRIGQPGAQIAPIFADTIVRAIAQATNEQVARQTGLSVGFMGNSQGVLTTNGQLAQGVASSELSIANSAGGLQSVAGGGIISGGAGNIISGGAGNIISGGAGNIISGGAGNIISGGAGNIISGGGGNIISGGGGNIISGGAGNLVSGGAGNIISGGAGNFRSVQKLIRPVIVAAMAFQSTKLTADVRSYKVREIDDTTVIVNLDGSLPPGTLVARGTGATPIVFPGKLR
ncbi:MAG: hypothetical protein JWM98_2801 [Thermoleophilia bacterium]|nr:hypothetical protein [Thermoleophilia bacterium]